MSRRAPKHLTAAEAAELRQAIGARPEVLVVARSAGRPVVLLRNRMAIRRPGGWELIAWVDIQRGGWQGEHDRLEWELVDGSAGFVALDEAGALPRAFAERVRASIVVQRLVKLADGLGTVSLVGRREPGTDDDVSWHAEGLGRCDLDDPRVRQSVIELMAELRAEFS